MLLQTHFRHENARRDRVYGKHLPNTRVDTSDLADKVSTIAFLEMIQVTKFIERDRRLDSATLPDLLLMTREHHQFCATCSQGRAILLQFCYLSNDIYRCNAKLDDVQSKAKASHPIDPNQNSARIDDKPN
jgi:hypothetical protein